MKVAREAAAVGTKSADKYLDELLVFREHAWHHIYAVPEPYAPSNLPEWAKQSWRDTSDDPRPVLLTPNQLEYAASPFELWNLCQHSLVRHGELHNNLRMTWGKAFPLWTKNLDTSLEQSQMLNDKYALDGRDPSSVVGIQWCHGLFDRAFFPSEPVMGVVRKRDIVTHSSRLDTDRYGAHVNRNPSLVDGVYLLQGRDPLISFVANILVDQGYTVRFTDAEDGSPPIESIPLLIAQDSQSFPTWLVEKYALLNEEMNAPKNSADSSHVSDGQSEDDFTSRVENQHHAVLCIISTVGGRLAFTATPHQSERFSSTGNESDHSFPLVEQLRHAAWDLARRMFALHAHQSGPAYAVQTRLF